MGKLKGLKDNGLHTFLLTYLPRIIYKLTGKNFLSLVANDIISGVI